MSLTIDRAQRDDTMATLERVSAERGAPEAAARIADLRAWIAGDLAEVESELAGIERGDEGAVVRRHHDGAPRVAHHPPHVREAHARAAELVLRGVVGLKDPLEALGGDADAVVADRESRVPTVVELGVAAHLRELGADPHAPGAQRELDGVAGVLHHVDHGQLKLGGVDPHPQRGLVQRHFQRGRVFDEPAEQPGHLLDPGVELDLHRLQHLLLREHLELAGVRGHPHHGEAHRRELGRGCGRRLPLEREAVDGRPQRLELVVELVRESGREAPDAGGARTIRQPGQQKPLPRRDDTDLQRRRRPTRPHLHGRRALTLRDAQDIDQGTGRPRGEPIGRVQGEVPRRGPERLKPRLVRVRDDVVEGHAVVVAVHREGQRGLDAEGCHPERHALVDEPEADRARPDLALPADRHLVRFHAGV